MVMRNLTVSLAAGLLATSLLTACGKNEPSEPSGEVTEIQSADPNGLSAGKSAMVDLINKYDTAFDSKSYDDIVDLSLPPALLSTIAASEGKPAGSKIDDFRQEMISIFEASFSMVNSLNYEWDAQEASVKRTAIGREYALLPTTISMELGSTKIKSTGNMITVGDGGRWYVLSPSDAESLGFIEQTYPDIKALNIKPTTMDI